MPSGSTAKLGKGKDADKEKMDKEREKQRLLALKPDSRVRSVRQSRELYGQIKSSATVTFGPKHELAPLYEAKSEQAIKHEESLKQRVPKCIECTNGKCKRAIYPMEVREVVQPLVTGRKVLKKEADKQSVGGRFYLLLGGKIGTLKTLHEGRGRRRRCPRLGYFYPCPFP